MDDALASCLRRYLLYSIRIRVYKQVDSRSFQDRGTILLWSPSQNWQTTTFAADTLSLVSHWSSSERYHAVPAWLQRDDVLST
jgi:hypothetical protein